MPEVLSLRRAVRLVYDHRHLVVWPIGPVLVDSRDRPIFPLIYFSAFVERAGSGYRYHAVAATSERWRLLPLDWEPEEYDSPRFESDLVEWRREGLAVRFLVPESYQRAKGFEVVPG